jgi:hypothetical protein
MARLLTDQIPVVTDLMLGVAEALTEKPIRAAFLNLFERKQQTIDGASDPFTEKSELKLVEGNLELRIRHDTSYWNDTDLADSTVWGFLTIGAKQVVTVWVGQSLKPEFKTDGLDAAQLARITALINGN